MMRCQTSEVASAMQAILCQHQEQDARDARKRIPVFDINDMVFGI